MAIAKATNDAKINNNGSAGTIAVAYPNNFSAGSLLVAVVVWGATSPDPSSVVDGLSQSWTKAISNWDANNFGIAIYYKYNTGASSSEAERTVTVTWAAAQTYRYLSLSEFTGIDTAADPLDEIKGVYYQWCEKATADELTTGNTGTPDVDGELFFGVGYEEGSTRTPLTAGTDFTGIQDNPGGTAYNVSTEYYIQTTKAAKAVTWSVPASDRYGALVATFKAAAGGATNVVQMII